MASKANSEDMSVSRRSLVGAIGASLAMPWSALAQPAGKVARIATVLPGDRASAKPFYDAFVRGLATLGYVQGRNVELTVRYADGNTAMVPSLLREAVAEGPDVIVTAGAAAAVQGKAATSTIPIVVATASDLVEAGAVRSLARPAGNITGLSDLTDEATAKRVQLTREMLPAASRIALLIDPAFPAAKRMEQRAQEVANAQRFELLPLYAVNREELAVVLRGLGEQRIDALVIGGSALHATFAKMIIDAGIAARVPVVHYWTGTAEAGALASHGANALENFKRAASYVDRILKGAKPGDLPIEQPTTFEFAINMKTAKALGLKIPPSIVLRADRVIE
jgi:putative tryptophan/tyrosine transport system substrate-binding protein